MTPEVSVVIPVHNEAENIGGVIAQTATVLRSLGQSFEMLVVNDASTDTTAAEICAITREVPECRELALPRHVGQADALLTGLAAARGRWIVTLDGDGQNDPADIPALFEPVRAGAVDMMCGIRCRRRDGLMRIAMSRFANAIRRRALRDGIHDAGCQLRVFRREIVPCARPMELMQSFLPALAVAAGYRVAEHPVQHHRRQHGRSNYGLIRLSWRPALAMLRLRRELRTNPPRAA
jgi:glycosyltransferase involved in cell wall biosynthesis